MNIVVDHSPSAEQVNILRGSLRQENVKRAPELLTLPYDDFLILARDHTRRPIGGAYCQLEWGYLFVDTLWVDESLRGRGLGNLLMSTAESYAAWRGVPNALLLTMSFQAQPFYAKRGYQTLAQIDNRPPNHITYFMGKKNLALEPIDPRFTIQVPPQSTDLEVIENGLLMHIANYDPMVGDTFAVWVHDEQGKIRGGAVVQTYWQWGDLHYMWLDPSLRGNGIGSKIIDAVEKTLREKEIKGILCDTMSFQARPFYEKQGFDLLFTLPDSPAPHERHFMLKHL